MRCLVVYDSCFGNTEALARAMADALARKYSVTLCRPHELSDDSLRGVGMLIAGSPTRGFRPTELLVAAIERLSPGALMGVACCSFDTRFDARDHAHSLPLRLILKLGGYAAGRLKTLLVRKGGAACGTAEGFFVDRKEGPLRDGEIERAVGWVNDLAGEVETWRAAILAGAPVKPALSPSAQSA